MSFLHPSNDVSSQPQNNMKKTVFGFEMFHFDIEKLYERQQNTTDGSAKVNIGVNRITTSTATTTTSASKQTNRKYMFDDVDEHQVSRFASTSTCIDLNSLH